MSETSRALGLRKALIDAETANRVEVICGCQICMKSDPRSMGLVLAAIVLHADTEAL